MTTQGRHDDVDAEQQHQHPQDERGPEQVLPPAHILQDAPFLDDFRAFMRQQAVHISCRPEDVERFTAALADEPGFATVTGDENVPVGKAYAYRYPRREP